MSVGKVPRQYFQRDCFYHEQLLERINEYFLAGSGDSGVTRGRGGGADRSDDTLQGVIPEGKKFVGKFTKNSGETRSNK